MSNTATNDAAAPPRWHHLIVTASNDLQAKAYQHHLAMRQRDRRLDGVEQTHVVADPDGQRIGSGGSTIYCLMHLLNLAPSPITDPSKWREAFNEMRVLIIHAGGDSKRLPAYGPGGKVFVPVPTTAAATDASASPRALFDELVERYSRLPLPDGDAGQVVVVSGDALACFEPEPVELAGSGMTAVGVLEPAEVATKHGVFCLSDDQRTARCVLQKPTVQQQRATGAINARGQTVLDIGVMNFAPDFSAALLNLFDAHVDAAGRLVWPDDVMSDLAEHGLDLYREVCCALGTDATAEHHAASSRGAGATWSDAQLRRIYQVMHELPMTAVALDRCPFLHFGTTRQLITSGQALLRFKGRDVEPEAAMVLNTQIGSAGSITGGPGWIEGCDIGAPVSLAGDNVLVGATIRSALALPRGLCMDAVAVRDTSGDPGWLVRCYGIDDQFKDRLGDGATYCNQPVQDWLDAAGIEREEVWPDAEDEARLTLWDAKLFPLIASPEQCVDWCWMWNPSNASADQIDAWRKAKRFSLADAAWMAK